jgi:hypothetical protein
MHLGRFCFGASQASFCSDNLWTQAIEIERLVLQLLPSKVVWAQPIMPLRYRKYFLQDVRI